MPKCKEITRFLEQYAPLEYKEEWDHVGLQIGDEESEITGILFALDLTLDVIKEAASLGYNMIYTHHPLIFKPIFNVLQSDLTGKKIIELIKGDIQFYCAHTNLDKTLGGVNDKLAELLGLTEVKGLGTDSDITIGRIGILETPMTLRDFTNLVKEELNCDTIKFMGDEDKIIKIVAVASGAASEFFYEAVGEEADVFVTSEIKHHVALSANELQLALIDAGHFETENIILEDIADLIAANFSVPLCISKVHRGFFKKPYERENIEHAE